MQNSQLQLSFPITSLWSFCRMFSNPSGCLHLKPLPTPAFHPAALTTQASASQPSCWLFARPNCFSQTAMWLALTTKPAQRPCCQNQGGFFWPCHWKHHPAPFCAFSLHGTSHHLTYYVFICLAYLSPLHTGCKRLWSSVLYPDVQNEAWRLAHTCSRCAATGLTEGWDALHTHCWVWPGCAAFKKVFHILVWTAEFSVYSKLLGPLPYLIPARLSLLFQNTFCVFALSFFKSLFLNNLLQLLFF